MEESPIAAHVPSALQAARPVSVLPIAPHWRRAALAPVLLFLVLCLLEFAAILWLNDGRFLYTLDDAYIHLALAEGIAQGYYGINAAEPAAPSSSILWPLLLAPFSGSTLVDYLPLVINVLAAATVLGVLYRVFAMAGAQPQLAWRYAGIAITSLFALNLVGLTFMGMEHAPQVLLAVLLVYGLIVVAEQQRLPWWLLLAIVLGPLVRYENLALSVPALMLLLFLGRARLALALAAFTLAPLLAFSAFLRASGLSWLPNSVIAKSEALDAGGPMSILRAAITNGVAAASSRAGVVLLAALALLVLVLVASERARNERLLALFGAAAIVLHLMFAGLGWWFYRYEIYILAAMLALLAYLFRRQLRALAALAPWRLAAVLAAMFAFVGFPHLFGVLHTPLAARNIYLQHYQMQRLAQTHYGAPVAVNDLGLVAYHNPHYVLDLWGLASAEALRARKEERPAEWMAALARERGVRLAMIYDDWYEDKPATWIAVGQLVFTGKRVTAANRVVSVYATDAESAPRVRAALTALDRDLPAGACVIFAAEPPDTPRCD